MRFGSDNQTGASANVVEALAAANAGFTPGYGNDDWSERAIERLQEVFECDLQAYFVATGTAANSLALSCISASWETILCHRHAHIYVDESTAPELFTGGARLIPLAAGSGKLCADEVDRWLNEIGNEAPHNPRPAALSISDVNEVGLVYTAAEIRALAEIARKHDLKFHMDGARFANAVAALDCAPAELSWKAGIDVLCLGATKCGALCAEAVLFFDTSLARSFIHRRKRSGHLLSKGRFFAAQFLAWLDNEHWLDLARHANAMAGRLRSVIEASAACRVVWPADANQLFVTLPQALTRNLRDAGADFYPWCSASLPAGFELPDDEVFVRLVTSFATEEQHIVEFERALGASPT